MSVLCPFFFGFLAAIVGVFPPGIINMTAAKVSLEDGRKRAMMFVLGALIIVFFQTCLSVMFAQYIDNHHEVIVLLREIGFVIFVMLTIYFLKFAKTPEISQSSEKLKSKRSRFLMGMIISAINFFPIPYYALITITLASYNVFSYHASQNCALIMGIVIGSFAVFYFYVVFFNHMKSRSDYFLRNMNTMIGLITGLVALLTLCNILKYYY